MTLHLQAILLLGPTGSGKTPLGDFLEQEGLWGHRCLHFDFGAGLRAAGARDKGDPLEPQEREVVQDSLRTGALLEDEHFPIALRILDDFLERRGAAAGDLVVLNGLPRHPGQASALAAGPVETVMVVLLQCSSETVLERIQRDPAGDRRGRIDDDLESVTRKLRVFEERTRPLADWYRERGVPIEVLEVGAETLPGELYRQLAVRRPEARRVSP